MKNPLLTVFTPTYNRAYILPQLYESLLRQTNKDFEWLIVDDGSTDDTEEVVKRFINESRINLRYIKQQNGGKHRAINRGVTEALGEFFFIVDSDDYLKPQCVEFYLRYLDLIKNDEDYAGISGRRLSPNGVYIGSSMPFEEKDSSSLDLRMKYGITGDMAEAYKTAVLKKYPFPDIAGEYFCPESLIWNRIAQKYLLRYFNEGYYICEYLEDGLTSKISKLRMNSPETSMLYYSELEKFNIPFLEKIKANINYWRFAFNSTKSFMWKQKKVDPGKTFIGMPIGFLMHINDKCKL